MRDCEAAWRRPRIARANAGGGGGSAGRPLGAKRRVLIYPGVASTAEPVPTSLGFAFIPGCAMAALPLPVDTLLVSGGSGSQCVIRPDILDWLRCNAHKARRFGSICTGAFAGQSN